VLGSASPWLIVELLSFPLKKKKSLSTGNQTKQPLPNVGERQSEKEEHKRGELRDRKKGFIRSSKQRTKGLGENRVLIYSVKVSLTSS